jgi:hypothetical protein
VSHDMRNPYADLDDAALCTEARRVEAVATQPPWKATAGWNNGGCQTADFHIPGHNGGATVEMLADDADFIVAARSLVPELTERLEARDDLLNAACALHAAGWSIDAAGLIAGADPSKIAERIRRSTRDADDATGRALEALDALGEDEEPEPLVLSAIRPHGENGMAFALSHSANHAIIEMLASMLDRTGAVNYVTLAGWHPSSGAIECTVQRVGKITPHTGRVLAEQHLQRAVALLAERGIAWDGPTEFLPDQPIDEPAQDKDHPWIKLDFRQTPNLLRCERCGESITLPMRTPVDALTAMNQAFTKAHAGCKEST